ncbi:TetR/AcrR family transcriptional regulator [Paenibacillus methanolicus]|uniref:Regulatory TetR family protein n=1 Tax=Paenibacillus methanolicus TaxID=582686 RepID=A0A5S5C3R4_9BACL|nr:TetR/AcrR family transcriptional regulator [Paenibacillus methanolicus]TYP74061.1 regulatory TetR family protein [Paenibacillus methanolicus]
MDEETTQNELPRGVALSWGIVKEPQRGPKREMNVKQIVDAAIAIADAEGLAAVSMNRVASSLGFTAMSLYRYIPSKEDLLLLMQDAVCELGIEERIYEGMPWREGLRVYVGAMIHLFQARSWVSEIPITGAPITPNNLQVVDSALRIMRGLQLTDAEKMSVILLLSSYARACGILQRDFNRALKGGMTSAAFSGAPYLGTLSRLVTPERFPDLHPLLVSGAYTGTDDNAEEILEDFDFGLERILDGIEHYMAGKS